jgi:Peptidase family C25
MRQFLPFLLLFFCFDSTSSVAQTYGNEWINYSQTFYKFKILNTGIHRLNYSDLTTASVPTTSFSSANIQIFGREQELPIHIEDGGDNSLDSGDYILFYAQKNDGWLDSTLYANPDKIGNPAYSLYNDSIYYFFTWNNLTTNKRFVVETDNNFNAYTPSTHIQWLYEQEFHTAYFEGVNLGSSSTSFFNDVEGFCRTNNTGPFTFNYNAPTAFPYYGIDGEKPKIIGHSFTSNNPQPAPNGFNHHLRYLVGPSDSVLLDTLVLGAQGIQLKTSFGANLLGTSNTSIKWNIVGDLAVTSDVQGLTYLSLRYPKQPNLTGFTRGRFTSLNSSVSTKSRLDLVYTATNPIIFSFGDVPRKLNAINNGSGITQVLIPNNVSSDRQELVFSPLSNAFPVDVLTMVGANGQFKDYSQFTPDSALLIVYHKSLEQGTQDYKAYRQSVDGGSYQVIEAEVEELYLQFGGGIPKHINGIRRYAHFMYNQSVKKPAALFLVGKGIREAIVFTTTASGAGTRTNTQIYAQSLVPSFGQPSSDIAITASLIPNNWAPLIPTGRLSVTNEAGVQNYLAKVIEHENGIDSSSVYTSADKDWQKQVLHFAGGTTQTEQIDFRGFLESMEGDIENEKFGGNVTRIYKNNSDPLDPSTYSEIATRLASGVSIMNFFGHANSQTSGFEINLDEPSNWNNQGKYPFVIANTCYNGNIFYHENLGFSTSEKFVRAQNSGAIGFLSAVSLGFSGPLFTYTKALYQHMSLDSYGLPIAKQIQNAIESLPYDSTLSGLLTETMALQMTYNGDPLVHLNWHTKPEIELLEQNISFSPSNIDLSVDSITVHIELTNLGQSILDTVVVEIRRDFPESATDSVYFIQLPELHYNAFIDFKVPLQPNIGIGVNQFSVSADIPSFTNEVYDEISNNQVVKTLIINIDGIQPVSPPKFAVVPTDSIVLKASTIDPLASIQTYRFEIDTTDTFNSPELHYQEIVSIGGVKEAYPEDWKLASNNQISPLIAADSTVFFWRVALSAPTLDWKESSFQYISGKSGWGQDHFYQFEDNSFNSLEYDRPNRKLHFTIGDTNWVDVMAVGTNAPTSQNQWLINNTQQEYDMCTVAPSLHVGVVDPFTFQAWGKRWVNAQGDTINPTHGFGNANDLSVCRNRVEKYFIFRQNSASQLAAFQNMVLNEVPNGHYLIIYAPFTGAQYNLWNSIDSLGMYSTFAALGSDSIHANRPNRNMAFFVKKGDPNSVIELFGQFVNDPVHLTAPMIGVDYFGQEVSPFIGPAKKWENFYWKQDSEETIPGDTSSIEIETFDINKNSLGAYMFNINANDSVLNLESYASAALSPYVRLRSSIRDSINFTPPQLDRWHVLYEPTPEAAIDGTNGYYWTAANDTTDEGSEISFAIDVRNIFDVDMDSLLVHYYIEDQNHVKHYLPYPRQDSLRINETLRDTITFSTFGYPGSNIFWMEVNPYIGQTGLKDQAEQFHFNNLLHIPFHVNTDEKNPLLDVTFDGRRILNGDIINPYAEVLITLKDDNPLLLMNEIADTALFGVYLTDPNGVQKRIPFEMNGQTVMQWIPATAQNKRFKIMYPGAFEQDGKYTLLVQGSDKSGNLSGDLDFRITFEVVTESSITKLMNYPNPFSTSTRFVFTLTGSEVPDDVLIQIMTVSGKIVREINEVEFGPMYIGRNISEFAWDGKDQFGDQLANGVYLYRVQMKLNGENMKQRESGADTYFTKEFGKMYLMR